jgi:RNA polymerase sigma factor (TIGR02999 family)
MLHNRRMPDGDFTQLLQELGGSGAGILPEALPRIYDDLRRLAGHYLGRERGDHTLQPTALVHEAYLKLADQDRVHWRNRSHFIGVAAQLMRRILVDHARAHHAGKRGGHATRVPIEDDMVAAPDAGLDLVDLDTALTRLAALDPRQARIVDLRYFGGLSVEETADALELSPATIKREWQLARAWLHRELQPSA